MTHYGKLFRKNFGNTKIPNKSNPNFYTERGTKVKRGSKLDKAIMQYKEKGYYTTDIGDSHYSNWRKEPPTLRPALFGGTFHQKNYYHPLATKREKLRDFE